MSMMNNAAEKGDEPAKVAENASNPGLGIRHVQVGVLATAAFIGYTLRTNLSIAIVAMVTDVNATAESEVQTFEWDEKLQGYILSAFYWGYLVTQIPAGILTSRYGAHLFLCTAILGSSVLTLLFPLCAYIGGFVLVCANRMLQGIFQGFLFPSIFALLGVWVPPAERSRLASIAVSAQLLGTVASTPLSGFLSSAYGWPSVFYVLGGVGVVVGIVMIFLGSDDPSTHRMISGKEMNYIQSSLGGAKKQGHAPWKSIVRSVPVHAAIITFTFKSTVYTVFLTKIPTFLGTVLKFDMKGNGLLSALPFLTSWLLTFVFSWICDWIIARELLKLTPARKVFNSIAHFGGAIFIVLLAHSDNEALSVVLLTVAVGCFSGTYVGVHAGFVDMAPNFSGAIYSIANFVSTSIGLCGPIVVGYIVTEKGSAEQWRIVFYVCAGLLVMSNLIYLIWGTSETQWWNWPDRYSGKSDYLFDSEMKKRKRESREFAARVPRHSIIE